MASEAETLDLVVVGAGWFGLCAAKTYHQLHPEATFAVLDTSPTIGGVWAEHRLYPGLKSNNMLGTYEYPDFPMDTATYGVQPGEHIPGTVVHRYLADYAKAFAVTPHVRSCTKVTSAELRPAGGWTLSVVTGSNNTDGKTQPSSSSSSSSILIAKKLIIATGLTSEPFLPHFEGQETFGAPIFHSKDFLQHAATLESAKAVTIFGGTKSAWDMVYAYASKGIHVDWVIRSTGHGPIWQAPPYVTPLKKWLEKLVMTRLLTWFSPCIWGDADGYTGMRGFYHGTAVGRAITNSFWSILGGDVIALNKYAAHPETAKLKPWSEAMFTGSSFSILNYPTDFFELIRNGTVRVHIGEIASLSPGKVHLTDGTTFASEALGCATGWKHVPPMTFLPAGIERDLGLPHAPSDHEPIFTPDAVDRADKEILARFPRLRDQPVQNKNLTPLLASGGLSSTDAVSPATPLTPYTLYRFMLPPTERFVRRRDIAFAGVLMNFCIPTIAQAQALWMAALFDGELPTSVLPTLPTAGNDAGSTTTTTTTTSAALEKLRYETVLYSRFGKWRYPAGHGDQFPDFVFDALPYIDLLLGDLGLPIYRKGNGLLAEATTPYGPEDYKDLVAEWKAKVGQTTLA
ncbi:flavin-binding monooxygenase-like protein [Niveomyces insectorum RCEF 264]|uniref:L-ornithine N(5)-monooxygenase [NAD(P)H] n=1 Tax=Niveomyces insectorum RCEF 264 TaxID=1081102 RepID=A0A167XY64_9HYPO|nr:flavin-binding monooxygenase-like protein [Niveomyces insectorum RCEF 264]